ncbi:MAG: alanine racemase [Acidimicrobiales bacterium]|nr:alanine racemase [Acidimicrobiales bacterium]HRW37767.1 alanine racemase [Aquihabitans sp.]
MRPVWAEVDLGAIAANTAALVARSSPARVCAVVKADGYGHGAVASARAALAGGADLLAVALVAEGAELREAGIDARVLVLSQASPDELDDLVAHGLDATVYTDEGIRDLGAAAARRAGGPRVRVHLKVDTGMHRVGAQPADAVGLAKAVDADAALELASAFTHCAVADEPANPFTDVQLARFDAVLGDIARAGIDVPCQHAANTAAAIDHPGARRDLVRVGIGLYGIDPSPALAGRLPLTPALSLHARASHVKRVAAGEGISYGLRYRPERETTIATVPLGYADGLPRRLGELGGSVLLGGRRRPIAGSVTMDQILVDCGDDPVEVGDEVVLIGRQGDLEITAADWASQLGTIAYEVVCAISPRVPRRYREPS